MINYRPPSYAPRLAQVLAPPVVTAPPVVASSNPAGPAGMPVPEGLFWTAVAGAASWAAINTAMSPRSTTFMRVVGWVGGIGAGLGALLGLTGVVAPTTARTFPVRWYWY